jgi:hypothetical protein
MRSNSKNEQPRSSNEIAAELRMAEEGAAANKKGRADYSETTSDPVDVIESKIRDFDRIEEAVQIKINRLKAELAAGSSRERAEARAILQKRLVERVAADTTFIATVYPQHASPIADGLDHMAETERLVREFNETSEPGEQPIISAENALRRRRDQPSWLNPLHETVNLPPVDPADKPFRARMTDQERSARSAHRALRDQAMVARIQNEVAAAKPPTLSRAPLAIHPSGKLDLRRTA